eukprot:TRINITY_DN9478_c0_g1_i1.p1 TRINITY_DN9478_c0_g1~~TRINITY_DN9478_c0_g1_i1.p1  ORF type:complete len:330 (-),score=56.74 TRINITY_DN9478_c0_g1_i1:8-997(-)
MFCGSYYTAGMKKKMVSFEVEPLLPLSYSGYICGSQFKTDVLRDQLFDRHTYGFIIIDGSCVSFHLVCGDNKTVLFNWDGVPIPNKHGRGGQSQNRYQRLRVQKRDWYVSQVAELAVKHFIDQSTNQVNVEGLILAGCASFKHDLLNKVEYRLAEKVVSIVDVQYGGKAGLNEAILASQSVISELGLTKEKEILSEFFELIALGDEKYSIAADDTMYALTCGVLEKLIVSKDLDYMRYEVLSMQNETETLYLDPESRIPDGYTVVKASPLMDWLLENYHKYGTELHIVGGCSTQGSQFEKGFGGLCGILRYRIDLPSESIMLDDDDWEW